MFLGTFPHESAATACQSSILPQIWWQEGNWTRLDFSVFSKKAPLFYFTISTTAEWTAGVSPRAEDSGDKMPEPTTRHTQAEGMWTGTGLPPKAQHTTMGKEQRGKKSKQGEKSGISSWMLQVTNFYWIFAIKSVTINKNISFFFFPVFYFFLLAPGIELTTYRWQGGRCTAELNPQLLFSFFWTWIFYTYVN